MAYKDTLSKIIKESGLSLREIAKRCEKKGVSITSSYISQLQTGKLNPPSEEVSKAIAEVCKTDSIDLVLEGYMEKAPEIVKYYFALSSKTIDIFLELHNDTSNIRKEFNKLSKLHALVSYLSKLRKDNLKKPIKELINSLTSKFIEEYSFYDFDRFIDDDSMEPLIPKGSLLDYKPYNNSEPSNSDIIIFSFLSDTQKDIVRRYYRIDNKIVLIPENKNYEIYTIKSLDEIVLYGKVTQYTASI